MIWGWYTCTVILFLMAAVVTVDIPWSDQWCDRDSRREDPGPQPPTLPHTGGLSPEWSHSSTCLCVSILQGASINKCWTKKRDLQLNADFFVIALIYLINTHINKLKVGGSQLNVNLFVQYIEWTNMFLEDWGDSE